MKKIGLICSIFVCMFVFCGCSETGSNHPMLKKAAQSMRMGEYRNAEICYKKYLAKNPGAASVHYALANLYDEHLEEYLLAVYHYREALRLQPDAGEETVRIIEGYIKRCEQRYMQKGKSIKKVFLTDEQEIERMTAAYKKNLAEQQKKADAELARMKKEAEDLEKQQNIAEKQIPDSPQAGKIIEKTTEKTEIREVKEAKEQLSEVLIADTAVSSDKNTADSPVISEKIKTDSLVTAEKIQPDSSIEVKNIPEIKKPESVKDFSNLPPMQAEKVEKTPEKAEKFQEYKVKKGDTLSHLSRKFYGSVRYHKKLMEYNKISSPNALRVGKTIKVPPLHVLKGEK